MLKTFYVTRSYNYSLSIHVSLTILIVKPIKIESLRTKSSCAINFLKESIFLCLNGNRYLWFVIVN